MSNAYRITGSDALRIAALDNLTIYTDSRLANGAETVSAHEAREILRDNPESVWVSVTPRGWRDRNGGCPAPDGYTAADYWTADGMYLGPDDDGIEPSFDDAR